MKFLPCLCLQGLRWALIVAAGLTSLGSWIKVGSVGRDRFWVTMFGQVVVAVGQVFMLFLPPRLASVWFGPDQVSLACSLGFIGILVGGSFSTTSSSACPRSGPHSGAAERRSGLGSLTLSCPRRLAMLLAC